MADWSSYVGTLPYASELFGMYQPLLGWRSKRIKRRFDAAKERTYAAIADKLVARSRPKVVIDVRSDADARLSADILLSHLKIEALRPHRVSADPQPFIAPKIDTIVARLVSQTLGAKPPELGAWKALLSYETMDELVRHAGDLVLDRDKLVAMPDIADYVSQYLVALPDTQTALRSLFEREATIAGFLVFLGENHPATLPSLFFKESQADLIEALELQDPLLTFGHNAYDAILSPIGVVHLYRQYFFEFNSFLGPSTGHVWLSPGGTVELTEVSTRKVYTERTLEVLTETIQKAETTITRQDELADAVKEENRTNIKFGFTNVATYESPVFQDTATATFSLDSEKKGTREATHKYMRQQSEKLSSEIKRSFKSTFKTSTDVTDTSSKRYVLQNKTKQLVNYELRRKMRKVGVQVQDIGVQLCWQNFVDDPGRELGVGLLVHMAEPPEFGDLQQPDAVPMPTVASEPVDITIPFVGKNTDDVDNAYTNGSETEVGPIDITEEIEADFPQKVISKQANYTLKSVILNSQGNDVLLSVGDIASADGSSTGTFTIHLDYIHWHGKSSITISATLVWEPSQELRDAITAENEKRLTVYSAEKARRTREAFYKAARERIKLASRIEPRKAEDLREEERTVVYRALVKQLMSVAPEQSRHAISELIRTIFDVDKMLYFVAPEWWQPRLHRSVQALGEAPPGGGGKKTDDVVLNPFTPGKYFRPYKGMPTGPSSLTSSLPGDVLVSWGGGREKARDNYYITEDSAPAKLGSSLGWLLQLDGDDLRNAFLNSPWVKAVIPIRPGKEKAAINWLQLAQVEGSDGLDASYVADSDDPEELKSTPQHQVTIAEALDYLIGKIESYQQKARTRIATNAMDPDDPINHFAGSVPAEAVFEHGFYPLKDGVHFDQDGTEQVIFSQWMEILPTDQIVALQVEYDPKTLQVKVSGASGGSNDDGGDDDDDGDTDHDHDDDG